MSPAPALQPEFLGLSKAEETLVDRKATLGTRLRRKRIGSSPSRVAKMEAGDPGVSLDLLVQGLLAAGAAQRRIASALAPRKKAASA